MGASAGRLFRDQHWKLWILGLDATFFFIPEKKKKPRLPDDSVTTSTNADLKTLNQLYNIQDSEESSPNPRRTLI